MGTLGEIIDWLSKIEDTASRIYEQAAVKYRSDKEFSDLLYALSFDEKQHHNLVLKAGEALSGTEEASLISIDPEAKREIERPFIELQEKLNNGFSREELISNIITLEFSELNDIFLYAINILKKSLPAIQYSEVVNEIESHKDRLKTFLERPGYREFRERLGQLPNLSRDSILIIEANDSNLKLMKAILEGNGSLEAAGNSEEALRLMETGSSFSAILVDVDIPDSIELYIRSVERFPQFRKRFIFLTASIDPDLLRFFDEHGLRYLVKPASISDIRRATREVIHSANKN